VEPKRGPGQLVAGSLGRRLLGIVRLRVHAWQFSHRRRGGGAGCGDLCNAKPASTTLPSRCRANTTAANTAAANATAVDTTCILSTCLRQWQPHLGPERVARRLQHSLPAPMTARLAYPNRPPRRTKDVSRRLLWITASLAPLRLLGAGRSTRRSRLGAPGLCPESATGPAPLLAKAISARLHPRAVITASARARPRCRRRHRRGRHRYRCHRHCCRRRQRHPTLRMRRQDRRRRPPRRSPHLSQASLQLARAE